MRIVRLIYVSTMTEACDTEALEAILRISRKKNAARNITGVLCYDPSFFMQCLEGPRDGVNDLYNTIVQDPRHMNVVLLEYRETDSRCFGDWSMAFLHANRIGRETLRRYSHREKLDPYAFSAEQAREFLIEIVRQHHDHLAGQELGAPPLVGRWRREGGKRVIE